MNRRSFITTTAAAICPTCHHDNLAEVHYLGQCRQCNCGASEVIHLTGVRELTMRGGPGEGGSSLTMYGYDEGHRVPERGRLK